MDLSIQKHLEPAPAVTLKFDLGKEADKVAMTYAMSPSDEYRRVLDIVQRYGPRADGADLLVEIWRGIRKQGRAGWSSHHCLYFCPASGVRCAVGVLLSPSEYRPEMEKLRVDALATEGLLPPRLMPHLALLMQVQHMHDELAANCANGGSQEQFVYRFGCNLSAIASGCGYSGIARLILDEAESLSPSVRIERRWRTPAFA